VIVAIQYPDILGEFVDSRLRFEADGVQYRVYFEPESVKAGEVTTLCFVMQSVVDAPVEFSLALDLPKTSKKLQGFKVAQSQFQVTMEPGQVVELKIPIQPVDVRAKEYSVRLNLRGKADRRVQRVRPPKSKGRMTKTPIQDLVGLELVSSIGARYTSKTEKRPTVNLNVMDGTEPVESDLSPVLDELWKAEDLDLQIRATREFNDRRLPVVSSLTQPILFAAMLNESRQRFAEVGIQPTLGESIFLSKILTYTTTLFLSDEALQDGLFVPTFQRLLASRVPFDNASWLLMKFGYEHIVNLAVALSFGLLDDHCKERVWPLQEQRAARKFIVGQLRNRDVLPIDLLYVPLILGGILVNSQVVLEGEDVQDSLATIKRSRDLRQSELSQGDEQAIGILDELLSAGDSG
jgi:hypothetical protein